MRKGILATILFIAIALWYWFFRLPVYLTLPEPYVYNQTSDNIVYFWTAKRHKNFFKVGNVYQLELSNRQMKMALFSVTYASAKPEEMKLGFYPSDDAAVDLVADKYTVTALQLAAINNHK